jgi:Straboviridae homing endonuclease
MNHQVVYDNIISNAKYQNRIRFKKKDVNYVYYEDHHVKPKCLGGNNDKENLVLLTAREHYICHKLLTYIYPMNRLIIIAFHAMAYNKKYKKYICARDYKYAKELNSLSEMPETQRNKIRNANKNKKHTSEQNLKTSETTKKAMKRPEVKEHVHLALLGNTRHLNKSHSQSTKNIIAEKRKFQSPPMLGKHHSEATKQIIREKRKLQKNYSMQPDNKIRTGKRTSEEWQKLHPEIKILDPDGWDRSNYQFSWFEELIEYDEYLQRVCESTCMFNTNNK